MADSYKNIDNLLEDLLGDFNPKQQKVVLRRFGLKTGKRVTLQEIGDELGITRERVRQIEEDALKKLSPKVKEVAKPILDFANNILDNAGGVRRDDFLVSDVASYVYSESKSKHVHPKVRFLLSASRSLPYSKENDEFHAFWYADENKKKKFLDFVKNVTSFFKSASDKNEARYKNYLATCNSFAECHYLIIPKSFGVNVFGDFGLRTSPEIEPKTIRDKIYLVLNKTKEPLHFESIAKMISQYGLSKRSAHVQTVHNELIKDDRFILVGRGIYGLKEHGFEPGTVREVIAKILKKKGPMHSEAVVKLVNEQRILKENTILLGLQNRKYFRRLDDGRYHVKEA